MANRNRARTRAIKVHMFKTRMPYNEAARDLDKAGHGHQAHAVADERLRCWPIGSCISIYQATGHDSDSSICYCARCGNLVCPVCQRNPSASIFLHCEPCYEETAYYHEAYREIDRKIDEADEATQWAWREAIRRQAEQARGAATHAPFDEAPF